MKAQHTSFNFPILWQGSIYIMLGFTYIVTKSGMQLLNIWFLSILKKIIKKLFQVPNILGFLLGSVQLILYSFYKYKSKMLEKSTDVIIEEGPTQIVKGVIEMQQAKNEQAIEWASQSSMLKGNTTSQVTKIVPVSVHSPWGHEDNAKMGQGHYPWFGRIFFFGGVCYNLLNCFFKALVLLE